MKEKPVAIVLGGTYPHKSLLDQLKRRGYYTILVDYLEYSPAIVNADDHIRESTLDKEKVLNIAKNKGASLVISTCIDQANVTACYVGEKLGLPIPYSYKKALLVSNKVLMKKRMMVSSIPTAKYREFSDVNLINDDGLVYPLIVKPSDSNSSKGVRRVENRDELCMASKLAMGISRDGKFVVEEFLKGTEIGVDCFISKGDVSIIMTRERRKIDRLNGDVQQIVGSFWPASMNPKQLESIRNVLKDIATNFELDNTLIMMQAILINDDVFVIEFAPRIGGGENYKIIEILTGCNVIDLAIDSFLNIARTPEYKAPREVCADIYLYANEGLFHKIEGLEELKKKGVIEYWNQYKKSGFVIINDFSSNNRIGSFVVRADKKENVLSIIADVIGSVKIYDKEKNNLINTNLY